MFKSKHVTSPHAPLSPSFLSCSFMPEGGGTALLKNVQGSLKQKDFQDLFRIFPEDRFLQKGMRL